MTKKEKNDLLQIAIKVSKKAGQTILDFYGKEYKLKYKKDNSPLTSADLASNKIIISILRKTQIPILSEEDEDKKNTQRFGSDYVWIVDPLDGTKDFINQTGEFTVMIALVEKQKNKKYRPILGIIYKPLDDDLYYALENKSAWLKHGIEKTQQIKVSQKTKNDFLTMLTSRSHSTDLEKEIAIKFNVKKTIAKGSSLKACFVAEGEGEFNFNPSSKTQEWDVCASDIIIHEAGGKFTDTKGNLINYNKKNTANKNGYLVSNGLIHDDIIFEINNLSRV
jgi:3'(2'), 5'-bisphosphate nucleotidase